jgi:hypothetical protein
MHWDEDFGDGIVKQPVISSGVEVEQPIQRSGRKLPSDKGD